MNKLFFLFCFVMLSGIVGNAQDAWTWQYPLPQGNTLNSICFTDTNIGYAVGLYGTIIKTTNGGANWNLLSKETNYSLKSVSFIDNNTGYVVGASITSNLGIILKTTNGGKNWVSQIGGTNSANYAVKFIDSNTGYVLGSGGVIRKTTNGGSNWSTQTSGITNNLNAIYCTSPSICYAVGNAGTILKTTNGGSNWATQTSGVSSDLFSTYFIDANLGYVCGTSGRMLKTTNGGTNWTTLSTGSNNFLNTVYFTDANTGYAVGYSYNGNYSGVIIKTTNGGTNWITQTSILNYYLVAISFIQQGGNLKGYAVGANGLISATTNGGTSWATQTNFTSDSFRSVFFPDVNTGYVVGYNGIILKTSNGGNNWVSQTSGTTEYLESVYFPDVNTGYVVGYNGIILKTTNGGNNWFTQTSGTNQWLRSVCFVNFNNGYIVGDGGVILKTTNGGTNWFSQTGGQSSFLSYVYFIDENKGFITTKYGYLYRTTNGGTNWVQIFSIDPSYDINSICFANANVGYLTAINTSTTVTNYARIYKTTNGGSNWVLQPQYILKDIYSINFSDENNGMAIGYDLNTTIQSILRTTNGGANWSHREGITRNPFSQCSFIDDYNFVTVGYYGTDKSGKILKYRKFQNIVKGLVFYDMNNNNIKDPLEKGIANIIVGYEGNNNSRDGYITDSTGNYLLRCDSGNYRVYIPNIPKYSTINPTEYNGLFNNNQLTDSLKDFAIHFIPDIKDLDIYITPLTSFARPGFNVMYQIDCKNVGTDTLDGSIELNYDNRLSFINSIPGCNTINPSNLIWNFTNFKPLESKKLLVNFNLSATAPINDTLLFIAEINPISNDTTPLNNISTLFQIITGAIDPNEKVVYPKGDITYQQAASGPDMEYIIHFQNTGNDTAFTVKIVDKLSKYLNAPFIEILATSHRCSWKFNSTNEIEWVFDNILLPDSNTNEALSHGFVRYKVPLNINLPIGTSIKNKANIYFDYNAPIITNEVITTIVDLTNLPANAGTIYGPKVVCEGQNNVIYLVPPITYATSYIWTLPNGVTGVSNTNIINVNYGNFATSGNITVKGHNSNGNGLMSSSAITVNTKPITPIITSNNIVLHSNVANGNQWYNENGLINGATNQNYTVIENGDYYDIVTINGCSSDPSNTISITNVGIEFTENNKTFKVYPNPVSNELIIEINGNTEKTNFEILNAIGQVIFKGNMIDKTIVNTTTFSNGLYMIKFENGKTFEFKKIVKE